MTIDVAIEHVTIYDFDRPVGLGPHVIRLRPAPHTRTPIKAYSLRVEPAAHFLNWQQDPFGNFQARLVFPEKAKRLEVTVDLVLDMTVINPFDFFLEEDAEHIPFEYDPSLLGDLRPYLAVEPASPLLRKWLTDIDHTTERRTIDFLVEVNQRLANGITYSLRMEPGSSRPRRRSSAASDRAETLLGCSFMPFVISGTPHDSSPVTSFSSPPTWNLSKVRADRPRTSPISTPGPRSSSPVLVGSASTPHPASSSAKATSRWPPPRHRPLQPRSAARWTRPRSSSRSGIACSACTRTHGSPSRTPTPNGRPSMRSATRSTSDSRTATFGSRWEASRPSSPSTTWRARSGAPRPTAPTSGSEPHS